jgi:hypothetical protein
VEHEGQALGRAEGVEDDQQGGPDALGQQRLLLGTGGAPVAGPGGQGVVQRLLTPRPPGPQQVEADPGDHGGEPAAEVADAGRVGAAEAQPGLLDGVVGLAAGAEHVVGHGPKVGAVGLEPFGQPVAVVHRHILPPGSVRSVTSPARPM